MTALTKAGTDGVEDGRTDQEGPKVRPGLPKDLLGEVLVDRPIGHREMLDEAPDLHRSHVSKRALQELDAGGPSLRPALEHVEDVRLERLSEPVREERLEFVTREAQVRRVDRGDLAVCLEARDRQLWLSAAGDEEVQPGRSIAKQAADDGVDVGRLVDQVVVVEDEQQRLVCERPDVDHEGADGRLQGGLGHGHLREERVRGPAEVGSDRLDRGGHVVQERDPVAVGVVEPEPDAATGGALREVR